MILRGHQKALVTDFVGALARAIALVERKGLRTTFSTVEAVQYSKGLTSVQMKDDI